MKLASSADLRFHPDLSVMRADDLFGDVHAPGVGVALAGLHRLFLVNRLAFLGQKPVEKYLRRVRVRRLRQDSRDDRGAVPGPSGSRTSGPKRAYDPVERRLREPECTSADPT